MTAGAAAMRRFLCDEMLQRLGRWLRAAGYDTLIARDGRADRELLALARHEERLLLTRDGKLMEHRGAERHVLLLRAAGVDGWAMEIGARLANDWTIAPFSRCMLCNTGLAPLPPDLYAQVPPAARGRAPAPRRCPACGKVYWQGSHVERMRRRLEAWSARHPAAASG